MDCCVAQGHTRIAHPLRATLVTTQPPRLDTKTIAETGTPLDLALVRHCKWNMLTAAEATRELIRPDKPPTALFAASNGMALGAIRGAVL